MSASLLHALGWVLLALLALRLALIAARASRGRLPWTRLLVPGVLLVEGAGLLLSHAPAPWRMAKLATGAVLEVGLLALMAHRFFRLAPEPGVLAEDHLAKPLTAFLPPRVARVLAKEAVLLGFAFRFVAGGWRRPDPPSFSYHRDSAFAAILPALPLLLLGDLLLLEVLLRHLRPGTRLLIHALDVYGVIWVLGLWASFRRRPHTVEGETIRLHKGLLAHLDLTKAQIASVGPLPAFDDDWTRLRFTRTAHDFRMPGSTPLLLELNTPVRAIGLLGPGRPKTRVLVSSDNPTALMAALSPSPERRGGLGPAPPIP